jgi:hypothetical protein
MNHMNTQNIHNGMHTHVWMRLWLCVYDSSTGSTPSLWGGRQSGLDAKRGWSSGATSCGRSDLKAGAK